MKTLFRNIQFFLIIITLYVMLNIFYLKLMVQCVFAYKHTVENMNKNNFKIAQNILRFSFIILGIRYREFTSNIPLNPKKPYILVSNHQSLLDIISIYHLFSLTVKIRFIAKHSLKRHVPYASKILRLERHALIHRKNPKQALTQVKDLARRACINKYAIVVFPEGTRHFDGIVHPFKSGGIKLIVKECPNITMRVVAISGGKWFSKITKISTQHYKKKYFFIKTVDEYTGITIKNSVEYLEKAREKIKQQIAVWDIYEEALQSI